MSERPEITVHAQPVITQRSDVVVTRQGDVFFLRFREAGRWYTMALTREITEYLIADLRDAVENEQPPLKRTVLRYEEERS